LPIGPGHRDKRLICGFADFAYYSADAGGGFPQLTAKAIDVGFSARLHDGIDLGGGGGRMIFRGDEVKKGYWTLTPVRLIVRPLLLALPEERRRGWMGFLNIYWKETYVAGPITAAHFAAPSKDWAVQGELVRSFGFNIDIAALLPSNWHGPRTN
jgi:hypothetical protein